MVTSRQRRFFNLALGILFSLFLVVPLLKTLLGPENEEWGEKRTFEPMPPLLMKRTVLAEFPGRFEKHFNDNMGFRRLLTRWHSLLNVKILQKSPIPKVILGKDDWLFYGGDRQKDDILGRAQLSSIDLEAWRRAIEARRDWLALHGIRYLFMAVPGKPAIYPEHLPTSLGSRRGTTRLEQLSRHLKPYDDIPFLDLRSTLMEAKKHGPVFYRTDSHWTHHGALAACRAILHRMDDWFPGERKVGFDYVRWEGPPEEAPDLSNLLGISEDMVEIFPYTAVHNPKARRRDPHPALKAAGLHPTFAMGRDDARLRVVVFRDSMFNALAPFFSEQAYKATYVWERFRAGLIAAMLNDEKPNLVIEEVAARSFSKVPKKDPFLLNALRAERALRYSFRHSPRVLLRWGRADGFPGVHTLRQGEADVAPEGLVWRAQGPDARMGLPPIDLKGVARLVLRVRIRSPAETRLQIYFTPQPDLPFSEDRSASVGLLAGRNDVYLELPAQDCRGGLRLDPGMVEGEYVIEALEIRALLERE
jgi:hypothetical protein